MAEEEKKRPTLMTFNPDDIVGRGTFGNWFGRTDQDSYLELSDGTIIRSDKGIELNTSEEVDQVNERATDYIAKANEKIQADIDAYDRLYSDDDETTEEILVNDLNVKATDDTVASELSAEKVNTEYEEIVDLSGSTFGPGKDEDGNVIVDEVVTSDTTFIDPAIKEAQEAAAASATALKEAMTFGGVVYENASDLQAAIVAASAGGASMDQSVAGANTTASSGGDALGQVTVNEQNLNSSTLLGGVQEKAAAEPMSSGSAEDDAIDFYTKGRRSTILTTPVGLLNDGSDDGTFRTRRGLIA